ncbi:hypothetical protein [Microbacterium marinilacus]|uniref:MNN4 protein n=1 Tax=Microbacterium marinilacus TaxID=415209 RepID=A0ABP7BWE3_9MICO|nr:hypothetical protein [Microbacterium marinilacus]MBY0688246.1 hypothetical protein [Microbacterium marinilacus]
MTAPPPAQTPAHAGAALLTANRRRARLRRILLWIVVPVGLVALLLPARIVSMYAFAHDAIIAYVAGDYAGATAAARAQGAFNPFQPYASPYNAGTGLTEAGDLAGGRSEFERALPLAQGLESCAVRVNLALTIERQGDQALRDGDPAGATQLFGEALAVVAETPRECRSEEADAQSPDPERSLEESLDDLEERLKEKQQPPPEQEQPDPEEQEEEPQEEPQPSEDQLGELEDRLTQGEGERQQLQDEDGQSGSGTDRPW